MDQRKQTFRMTRQRRVILEELHNSATHPTVDEIYERVRRRMPRISLGTVYRNLEYMASHGLVGKLDLYGRQKRFDINSELHYHIRCDRCGALADVELESTALLNEAIKYTGDYEVLEIRLELLGLCPTCRKNPDSAEGRFPSDLEQRGKQ